MRNHSNYGHHVIPSVLWEGVGGAMGISLIMWSLQRSTWHSIYECCFLLSNWDLICIYIIQPSFGIALTDDFRFYMWKKQKKKVKFCFLLLLLLWNGRQSCLNQQMACRLQASMPVWRRDSGQQTETATWEFSHLWRALANGVIRNW